MSLLLVTKKITIERKPGELGKNLDILRKNFKRFSTLSYLEVFPPQFHGPFAKTFHGVYINP